MKNLRLCLLVVFPALFAQSPPPAAPEGPTDEQQATIIADIREAALSWESTLTDFTCTRAGHLEARTMETPKPPAKPAAAKSDPKSSPRPAASGRGGAAPVSDPSPAYGLWETLQITEDRVIYSGHKESYVSGPGNGTTEPANRVQGAAPAAAGKNSPKSAPNPLLEPASIGAFTGLLRGIFAEESHTEFTWKGTASLRGLPVYAFDYKVAKNNSMQELMAAGLRITVGYHGTVYADPFTHRVMTVSFEADVPPDFPEQDVDRVFDFGQVVMLGQFNLLPLKCQMQQRSSLDLLRDGKLGGKSQVVVARLTTDFLAYRKYTARDAAAQ